jgi:hypothetical protein
MTGSTADRLRIMRWILKSDGWAVRCGDDSGHFHNEGKPDGFILELSMFPETKFMILEEKPKDERRSEEIKLDSII